MKKVQEEYGMLDQEKIKDILVLASKEVRNYFGYKNVEKSLMELKYDPKNNIDPRLTPLVYSSFSIRISVINIEKGGALTYSVNLCDFYNLKILVPQKISQRISSGINKEDIQKSLEVLDEYLIWRMTDAQKKVFGIPLDKKVLKED